MKCGFVSIVGRPNVGKSTLLNSILGMKLAITSNVSGTTRNIINGIYNDNESQIIFVDTPGIHKPNDKLGSLLNKKAYSNTDGVDIILFLVDVSKGIGNGDKFILEKIKDKEAPIYLLLNKIDLVKDKTKLLSSIDELKELQNAINRSNILKEIYMIKIGDKVLRVPGKQIPYLKRSTRGSRISTGTALVDSMSFI